MIGNSQTPIASRPGGAGFTMKRSEILASFPGAAECGARGAFRLIREDDEVEANSAAANRTAASDNDVPESRSENKEHNFAIRDSDTGMP